MAIIQSTNKIEATRAFINTWLKDNTMYCNHCGENFNPVIGKNETGSYIYTCCENPQIGRNYDHTKGLVEQNKEQTKNLNKNTAATESNSMRLGVSMPPRLYNDLKRYFKSFDEKFLDTPKELHAFMKAFPEFTIPRII